MRYNMDQLQGLQSLVIGAALLGCLLLPVDRVPPWNAQRRCASTRFTPSSTNTTTASQIGR